jgi:hypothetical protein
MSQWAWVLTGNDFRPVGEVLNTYDLACAFPLSKLDTASFRVRVDNPLADQLLTCKGYLKGYRGGVLRYMGPVISAEENVERDNGSVAVNSVGAGWIFSKRFAGKSAAGDVSTTATDRAVRFTSLLGTCNTENDTHIQVLAASAASSVIYSTGAYKKLTTCLQELSAGADGFDWRVLPIDNFDNGVVMGSKIGNFVAQPLIGSPHANAVFEHGIETRHNIASYRRTVTREDQANKIFHNAAPGPDAPGYPTVSALDTDSISDWGLLEDLADADLLDLTLRTQLVGEHRDIRKQPRQRVDFTPIASFDPAMVPQFGVDFDVGDVVPARAIRGGVTRWAGEFRVWGVSFTVDINGVEQMTVSLVDEGD